MNFLEEEERDEEEKEWIKKLNSGEENKLGRKRY
jgi:hypothetical protein